MNIWISYWATTVNSNGIKKFLANSLNTFLIKDNPVFSNGPKNLPKNSPGYPILCHWVFGNFMLAEEPFAKALQGLKSCVLVNDNLCGKLFLSLKSLTKFD